jgi:hypothetical protein
MTLPVLRDLFSLMVKKAEMVLTQLLIAQANLHNSR